jgi:hypothetical protein
MTHEELLARIKEGQWVDKDEMHRRSNALRAVVELHKPALIDVKQNIYKCIQCSHNQYDEYIYPCQTIQAIEKELKNG